MKKISMIALGTLFAVVGTAGAGFDGPDAAPVKHSNPKGGFVNENEVIVTVKQVNELRDDVPVIVKGKILQRIGDEKYLFEDSTGSITIEIDDDDWRGQTISPSDSVKVYGDVDRGIFKTEIDVDYIEKL
ncbi:MAG: YgiW/YdeI family stress tolerance OB fold protein [Alphaproteobacteria bacterium]|nr:YgiW/YdeI family stress tolerance OB fold protein [Alphaproteobacteria bacterium]